MPIVKRAIIANDLRYKCDNHNCKGEMEYANRSKVDSIPNSFTHMCNKCNSVAVLDKIYPVIERRKKK